MTAMGNGRVTKFFSSFSNLLALWLGSHWAFTIAGVLVVLGVLFVGVATTNIAISIATLLMVVVLQNTQNRESAALHVKLDELVTRMDGPRDEVAGIESASHEEIEELRETGPSESERELSPR
jgi:low affinity Fe/Cu permease